MSSNVGQAEWQSYNGDPFSQVPKTGNRCVVFFRAVQTENKVKSKREGHPVIEEQVHIVKIPADIYLRIDRKATEKDKEEFAAEWQQWERTRESRVLGIPIDQWPAINDNLKAQLKAMSVQVVEQVADAPDSLIQKIMGGGDLRKKAQAFLNGAKDAALAAENQKLAARLAEMEKMLSELTAPKAK